MGIWDHSSKHAEKWRLRIQLQGLWRIQSSGISRLSLFHVCCLQDIWPKSSFDVVHPIHNDDCIMFYHLQNNLAFFQKYLDFVYCLVFDCRSSRSPLLQFIHASSAYSLYNSVFWIDSSSLPLLPEEQMALFYSSGFYWRISCPNTSHISTRYCPRANPICDHQQNKPHKN